VFDEYLADDVPVHGDFFVTDGATAAFLNSAVALQASRQTSSPCTTANTTPLTEPATGTAYDTITASWVASGPFHQSGPDAASRPARSSGHLGWGTEGPVGEKLALISGASISVSI
jgi:hypothetical protein